VRTRSLLLFLLAFSAAAQTRLTSENVSATVPAGWTQLSRSELAGADPQPLFAAVRSDKSSFQIVKAKLAQPDWKPAQVAAASMVLLLLDMKNGEVETPLHETTVAGLPAAEWTATYTIAKAGDGRARVISVVSGDSYYTIAASGPKTAREELDAIVKTVVITR